MATFRTTRRVKHTPERMFDLVANVEEYPQFVPLCEALSVRRRVESENGTEVLTADMEVGYKAIRERFTSKVTLDRPNLRILVEYVDGPFRYLENRWTFLPGEDGTGCTVEFFITYEFRSATLGFLMGAMFDKAFRRFATAFEARADMIYRGA